MECMYICMNSGRVQIVSTMKDRRFISITNQPFSVLLPELGKHLVSDKLRDNPDFRLHPSLLWFFQSSHHGQPHWTYVQYWKLQRFISILCRYPSLQLDEDENVDNVMKSYAARRTNPNKTHFEILTFSSSWLKNVRSQNDWWIFNVFVLKNLQLLQRIQSDQNVGTDMSPVPPNDSYYKYALLLLRWGKGGNF